MHTTDPPDLRYRTSLVLHGLLILLLGTQAGVVFLVAIVSQWETTTAWRVLHSGGSTAGVMLLALAGAWSLLNLGRTEAWFANGAVLGTWCLVGSMLVAALTHTRGLDPRLGGLHLVIFGVYSVGFFSLTGAIVLAIRGVLRSLRASAP